MVSITAKALTLSLMAQLNQVFGLMVNTFTKSVESARSECAKEAGKAGTEYAAKQIEKTCLAEKQLEPEPESKSWFDW